MFRPSPAQAGPSALFRCVTALQKTLAEFDSEQGVAMIDLPPEELADDVRHAWLK